MVSRKVLLSRGSGTLPDFAVWRSERPHRVFSSARLAGPRSIASITR